MISRETWFLLAAGAAVVGAAIVGIATVSAASAQSGCVVNAVASNGKFTVQQSRVTAKFEVKGDLACRQTVTLASWQAPDGVLGLPYEKQKLYSHTTGTFGPGTHTLTTTLPDCYYQVDLVRGTSATDGKGGPKYASGRLMAAQHGGSQKCADIAGAGAQTSESSSSIPGKELPATGSTLGMGSGFVAVIAAVVAAGVQYFRGRKPVSV